MEGFEVIVFYQKAESRLFRRDRCSLRARNTTAIGLKGTFDDAQRGVKTMLSDQASV